jgi:hypothetical protein
MAAAVLAAFLTGCSGKEQEAETKYKAPTALVVESVKINNESAPKTDGKLSEDIWNTAPASVIETADGPSAKVKSVYTDTNIYFSVSWEDKTEQDGILWWEYDGAGWSRNYETDDKVAFMWNIDNSVPDFDTSGCKSLCHFNANQEMSMFVEGVSKEGKPWEGIGWMADAWKWTPGIMQVHNGVEDGLFAAPKEDRKRPELSETVVNTLVFDGGDEGTKQWFTRNPNAATAEEKKAGIKKPAFMPKEGYDLEKNPFPNLKDMVQITDYTQFKAGDRIPMMVFFDLTNAKNKKDFPLGKPSGSRMDISGNAIYAKQSYTLEFGRKLDTGNEDDVQFKPVKGKAVTENVFGLALFNDTRYEHTVSQPVTLVLMP